MSTRSSVSQLYNARHCGGAKSKLYYSKQMRASYGRFPGPLFCSLGERSSLENHKEQDEDNSKTSLSSLDSYFQKLQGINSATSRPAEEHSREDKPRDLQSSLNAYFERMQPAAPKVRDREAAAKEDGVKDGEQVLSFLETTLNEAKASNTRNGLEFLKAGSKNAACLTNLLVGFNVAVFLFGLASPLQTPEMVEVSLPVFYGAKINELIAEGQWWRLVTPMFLHDGLIHIGLGAWALLSFGPAVEYAFGSAGFCMIYFLGGAFGNLMSFFHTPAPTVGGTGPLYALVAAWAVYVLQNRNIFGKELQLAVTADLIQKVLVLLALHFALADALPADNWTHVGATFVGFLFALIAAPKVEMNLQMGDSSDKVAFPGQAADLQRLLLAFAACTGVFLCLYAFGSPATSEFLTVMSEATDT